MVTHKGARALVLGGGIAGLSAAGVLARHFEEVLVLERDCYPAGAEVRPHALHGAHVHLLLAGGLVTLGRLVPELPGWLDQMGLPEGDLTYHTRVAWQGRWLPRARSGIPIRACTRPQIELLLRRDVARRPNVRLVSPCKITGLLGRSRVTGARISRDGEEDEVRADLVVDAMGRSSPCAAWLSGAGLPAVEQSVVDPGVVYASAWFEAPVDIADDWTVMATLPSIPGDARMGVIVRLGGRRMLCSVIDYARPRAPKDHDELVARMAELCVPQLHDLLRESRPQSPVVIHGNTQNRWRRYGRLPHLPDGLVILGDAACALNPRYGQGMTVASLSAERLDRELAARPDLLGLSRRFQRGLDRKLRAPWQIALLEDRAWVSSMCGARPALRERLAVRISQRVLRAAFSDVQTYIRFMRVAHLLDPPLGMLAPGTLARIALGGHGGAPAPADPPAIT